MRLNRLAILAPGLLGASVALAAKRRGIAGQIAVWARNPDRAQQALCLEIADVASADFSVIDGADAVVLASPVGAMPDLATRMLERPLAPGCLITDVGSVKGAVVARIDALFAAANRSDARFVGAHPMAGSEKKGMEHANADLFEKSACILTPSAATDPQALAEAEAFWSALGCRMMQMPAEIHDGVVGRISHLPHLAAAALVAPSLGGDPSLARYAGGGFFDSTRVAGGPAEMWAEILLENRAEIAGPLQELVRELSELLEFLEKGDEKRIAAFLEKARSLREDAAGFRAAAR